MKIGLLGAALVTLWTTPVHGLNVLDWLSSAGGNPLGGNPLNLRAPRFLLLEEPRGGPAMVHQLERTQRIDLPAAGEFVYSFGELSAAVSLEAVDTSTGVPYLVLVSTILPRKVLALQPLARGAEGQLMVVDENLAVTPEPRQVRATDIDPGSLSNRFFRIYDGRGTRTIRDIGNRALFVVPSDASDSYLSPPETRGFSAQMAYHHLSLVRRQLAEAGLRVPEGRAPVFVNVAGIARGMYLRRAPFVLAFGEKQAADADILYHEYGHAVLDSINAPLMLEGESFFGSAIHEAFGDVLAYVMNGNPRIGEWGGQTIRTLQNSARYPGGCLDPKLGQFEPHVASRVISGIFYSIAQRIGRMETLNLLVEAATNLPAFPSFSDVRSTATDAARARYGEQLAEDVSGLFEARGITAENLSNDAAFLVGERIGLRDGHGRYVEEVAGSGPIEVVTEGEVRYSRPGYNLIADLDLTGPAGFEKVVVLVNGHWPASNGQIIAPVGRILLRGAPPGTYQLRARVKLGGNQRTSYLYKSFTVR